SRRPYVGSGPAATRIRYDKIAPDVVDTRFTVFLFTRPRRSRAAPSTLSIWQPRNPIVAGMSTYVGATGSVGVNAYNRAREDRTNHPTTEVKRAARIALSWPKGEMPPSVPGG